jgi:hypothetical protein
VVDGVLFVGSNGYTQRTGLYIFDAATGVFRWHVKSIGSVWTSPVVVDGVVYVASAFDGLYAFGPAPFATAVEGSHLTTMVGTIQFASEIGPDGEPTVLTGPLPSGITTIFAVYDHLGVPANALVHSAWTLDGQALVDVDDTWDLAEDGRAWTRIASNQGALPNGTYEFVLSRGGQPVQQATVIVGSP